MSTVTTKLNLVKPGPLENFSLSTYNNNLDLIDSSVKKVEDGTVGVVSFLNGWTNYGAGYYELMLTKKGRLITATGMIKPGTTTSGIAVATMPVGFVPDKHTNAAIGTAAGSTYASNSLVQFATDGQIKLFNLPASLSYVMFSHNYMVEA